MGTSPGELTIIRSRLVTSADLSWILAEINDESGADLDLEGRERDRALADGLARSVEAWAVEYNGRLQVVVGVVAPGYLSDSGFLWLLCGRSTGLVFARHVREFTVALLERWPKLWGTVDPRRRMAERFLTFIGAKILDDTIEVCGTEQKKFLLGAW
jgi:hypothetical protein